MIPKIPGIKKGPKTMRGILNKESDGDGRKKPEWKKLMQEGILYGIHKKRKRQK